MPKHYRAPGKKKEGNAARYITRSQAVKHLQISLSQFRKLCILKGVFPREPKKKVKGNHHTYYHMKDILYLKQGPLLEKLWEMWAYERKVKNAVSKKNMDLAERLLIRKPSYRLDEQIKARYPRLIDALRDLDDCLSMVHLFAALPAAEREKIQVYRIHSCRRLSHEWQAYISRTHKLRKTFITIKGIYYQAEVMGQKILWLTPHASQQVLPDNVDYKALLNFLEFYEALLGSVNSKLYQSMNVKYPPILDSQSEALAAELYALLRYSDANSKASMEDSKPASGCEQIEDQQDEKKRDASELRLSQLPSNEPGALMHLIEDSAGKDEDDEDTKECKNLFKDVKFFLNREVPRESLLFVIAAFGGVASWEGVGAPFKETDQSITYQIVDRPTQGHKFLSREYVQPQWVYDCVNARIILPTAGYLVGRPPPPHKSPFVDDEAEGYIPDYAETIKRWQAAARKEILPMPGVGKEDLNDSQNLLAEGIIDRAEAIKAAEEKRKMSLLQKQYHDELRKELQGGLDMESGSNVDLQKAAEEEPGPDMKQIAMDEDKLSKLLMSRKKRKLLEAMEIGKRRKRESIDLLKERKRKINEAK